MEVNNFVTKLCRRGFVPENSEEAKAALSSSAAFASSHATARFEQPL
ncbi:MAG: hypothetical protein LC802_13050 [Acidobacteria bacterium]|nr:hypothetical protein [Acidobacteriota bacterium]